MYRAYVCVCVCICTIRIRAACTDAVKHFLDALSNCQVAAINPCIVYTCCADIVAAASAAGYIARSTLNAPTPSPPLPLLGHSYLRNACWRSETSGAGTRTAASIITGACDCLILLPYKFHVARPTDCARPVGPVGRRAGERLAGRAAVNRVDGYYDRGRISRPICSPSIARTVPRSGYAVFRAIQPTQYESQPPVGSITDV